MDIVRFKGGLGNQMFQYALVEALRHKGRYVGCQLEFYRKNPTLRPFVLDKVFPTVQLNEVDDTYFNNLDNRWKAIKQDIEKLAEYKRNIDKQFFYIEGNGRTYDKKIFQTSNCVFVGY